MTEKIKDYEKEGMLEEEMGDNVVILRIDRVLNPKNKKLIGKYMEAYYRYNSPMDGLMYLTEPNTNNQKYGLGVVPSDCTIITGDPEKLPWWG